MKIWKLMKIHGKSKGMQVGLCHEVKLSWQVKITFN